MNADDSSDARCSSAHPGNAGATAGPQPTAVAFEVARLAERLRAAALAGDVDGVRAYHDAIGRLLQPDLVAVGATAHEARPERRIA